MHPTVSLTPQLTRRWTSLLGIRGRHRSVQLDAFIVSAQNRSSCSINEDAQQRYRAVAQRDRFSARKRVSSRTSRRWTECISRRDYSVLLFGTFRKFS